MHVFLRSAMILRPNSWGLFRQLVDIGGALALPFQPTAVFLGTAEAKRKEQPVHKPGQAAQCQAALFKGADRTGGKIYSPPRKERRKRQCACINELPFSKYHQLCFFRKPPIHVKKYPDPTSSSTRADRQPPGRLSAQPKRQGVKALQWRSSRCQQRCPGVQELGENMTIVGGSMGI
jgi:hypothetical protein